MGIEELRNKSKGELFTVAMGMKKTQIRNMLLEFGVAPGDDVMETLVNVLDGKRGKRGGTTSHLEWVVRQLDRDTGEMIAEFESIAEASRVTNVGTTGIGNCIRGKHGIKTAGGFKWVRVTK